MLRGLGGGSRYEVLLVWDETRFAIMVAKVLRPAVAGDEGALEDLAEEAEALAALSHPVILRGFDAVLDGTHPHLLVEHLEGPTLRRLLRAEGRLSLQQLIPLGLHVAAGLAYLEAVGWVHLDLKPDNLIMGVPPRIIDLSIARTVERAARTRGFLGTDPYMAPEQCGTPEWKGRLGPPADIFGLAATLWRAAAGVGPFPRERGALVERGSHGALSPARRATADAAARHAARARLAAAVGPGARPGGPADRTRVRRRVRAAAGDAAGHGAAGPRSALITTS